MSNQQDQLILSLILTGISPAILPQVVEYKTSVAVWSHLRHIFASNTQTRQLHLWLQLQTIRKGNSSMEEFITRILVLKDLLATIGEGLKDSELILIILGALGDGYESFITSIMTRFDPQMTFTSLCELLMDQEIRSRQHQPILDY